MFRVTGSDSEPIVFSRLDAPNGDNPTRSSDSIKTLTPTQPGEQVFDACGVHEVGRAVKSIASLAPTRSSSHDEYLYLVCLSPLRSSHDV